MPLRNVGYFVCNDAREFVFASRGFEQARVHADVAAGQGEGINSLIIDGEERETVVAVVGLRDDAAADLVDVLGDQRILDNLSTAADIAHDHPPQPRFIAVGQDGIRRASHIRQIDVVGTRAAHEDQRCE